jgi:hypothetical protein
MSENTSIEVTATDPGIEVEGFVVVGPSPAGDHNHEHGTLTGLADPDHPTSAVIGLDTALAGKEAAGTAASLDAAHVAAADPHTGYQKESEKAAANGYASLDATTKVPFAQLPTGAAASTVAIGDHTHPGGAGHVIEDEGTPLTARANLNFTGAGVTATDTGGKTVVTIPGGGAAGITVQEENITEGTGITTLDFRGGGMDVVVTGSEAVVTVTDGIEGHAIANEGTFLTQRASMNFTGAGVNAVDIGGATVVDIPGGSLAVQNEGATVATGVTQIDFQGAGVEATAGTGEIIVTIPGGGGGGALDVRDEGISLTTAATVLDFTGYGVKVTEPAADQLGIAVHGLAAGGLAAGNNALPLLSGSAQAAPALGAMYLIPLYVSSTFTVLTVSFKVVTGGSTGSVVRLGVYTSAYPGAPYPAPLLADWGTVVSTAAAGSGIKTKTGLSTVLAASADPYWIAVVTQTAAPTLQLATSLGLPSGVAAQVPAMPFALPQLSTTSVTGALPGDAGCDFGTGTTNPVPYLSVGA